MTRTLAQITNPVLPPSLGGGSNPDVSQGGTAVGLLISNLIGMMLLFAFLTAFIYLLTGAFHWITSGGDKANLEHARDKIMQALVGLIVVAAAWATFTLVGQFLGVDITHFQIPTINQSTNSTDTAKQGCEYAKGLGAKVTCK